MEIEFALGEYDMREKEALAAKVSFNGKIYRDCIKLTSLGNNINDLKMEKLMLIRLIINNIIKNID